MERYLVQKKINGKWCNIKSYSRKRDAELVVNLSNSLLITIEENIRILDRKNKKNRRKEDENGKSKS